MSAIRLLVPWCLAVGLGAWAGYQTDRGDWLGFAFTAVIATGLYWTVLADVRSVTWSFDEMDRLIERHRAIIDGWRQVALDQLATMKLLGDENKKLHAMLMDGESWKHGTEDEP